MALQKQNVNINFAQGIETKTDPFQVRVGKFLALVNSIFDIGGLLQKRNGYAPLVALSDNTSNFITTFSGALTAIGNKLQAFSNGAQTWVNKGAFTPVGLSVLPLIRNNTNQTQCDTAISSTGLVCTVYTDQNPASLATVQYKYVVADSTTGQNLIAPTVITDADATYGTPRVFLLGNYFIVVFTNKVSSTYHLKYFSINVTSLAATSSTDISTSYTPSTTVAFDGAVMNNQLYIAWNGAGASGIKMIFLSTSLVISSVVNPDASHVATIVSVCADKTNQVIWVSYYDSVSSTGYTFARNAQLNSVLAPTQIISTGTISNLTSIADTGLLVTISEVANNYGYDAAIPSNYLQSRTVTQAGFVASINPGLRGVGLASKAFSLIPGGTTYFLMTYSSPYQPTYFLADVSGNIIAKLAYKNGRGYLTLGLPSVTVNKGVAQLPYLIKDLIQAVNKDTNVVAGTQTAGIYSQTGINLVSFVIGSGVVCSEIGNNLNISGGFLWAYDGYSPVEQNFHLYPDSVEIATQPDPTPTGDVTINNKTIINMSAVTGLAVGMTVTGTGIPANTLVTAVGTTTIGVSKNPTATNTTVTLTFTGNQTAQKYFYQATYEWTDNQGNAFRSAPSIPVSVTTSGGNSSVTVNVPTLRLTYKTANPVKIVIYRWSAAQQTYYQCTSINTPITNSLTTDSVAFVDALSDATILGNSILYTAGGVVQDCGAPACVSTFLFDDRLWLITAEDPNLLWFSKTVITATPVEMSDLLTQYVAPNTGAQGSSGPLTCGFPMDDKAILFKASSMLYFNGTGPDNTGINNQYGPPTLITTTVGCTNQNSIVFTPSGLMFEFRSPAGNQIWLLGRDLSTQYVGAVVEAFTQNATVQSVVNIPGSNQVRFTLSSGVTLMYDYFYRQWGTFVGVPAISSTLYQGLHAYLNSSGQVFQETPGVYLDGSSPVLMSFTTSWLNLAGLQGYQRAYEFYLLATYISPHKLAINIAYDYNPSPTQSMLIAPDNYAGVYGSDSPYGSSPTYGGSATLEQWRIFIKQQKCEAFQIQLTEIFDGTFGVAPGAGFTLSGLNMVYGTKKGWSRLPPSRQIG